MSRRTDLVVFLLSLPLLVAIALESRGLPSTAWVRYRAAAPDLKLLRQTAETLEGTRMAMRRLAESLARLNENIAHLQATRDWQRGQIAKMDELLAVLAQQVEKLKGAVRIIGKLERQTVYTEKITYKTYVLTKAVEAETRKGEQTTQKLRSGAGDLGARLEEVKDAMHESVKVLRRINKRLPDNLPI